MVLEDHKRRGRMLVPPMLDMPLQETRWHVERLPELFWLAFVGNRLGDRHVLQLAYEMAVDVESTIKRYRKDEKAFRAYFPSEHMSCSDSEREQVVANHRDARWFRELQPHFAAMAAVWNDFPFYYLVADVGESTDDLVLEIKEVLQECLNRHDKRSLIIQATTIALEFRTEKMSIAQGLDVPNLNAIYDYPETEESRHAAGFVVTTCGMTILCRNGPDEAPNLSWQRSFWNGCYRLGPCEYE